LRPALVRNNPELRPYLSGPHFGFALKDAIDSAILAGRLVQPKALAGREKLWLVEQKPEVQTVAGAPVEPLDGPRDGSGPIPAKPSTPAAGPVHARSAEFRKRLTDLGIFCEKRERDILFEALTRVLLQSAHPISRLRRELPKVAAEVAQERGVSCTEFKRIVNFFLKLFLMSEVLVGKNGEVIRRNVGAEAATVASLKDSALDRAEEYMIEQILKKSDVKDREHWQLAHAIFRQFDQSVEIDGMLDRIATLISALGKHFILADDGTYEYTEGASANVVAMRA
jgi:hypothetical protein